MQDKLWFKLFVLLSRIDLGNPLLLTALVLLPINYGIEALRWKNLASKIEPITFLQALQGTLTGIALGFITPSYIGEYAGRTLSLQSRARARSAGSLLVNSASQFLVTFVFGGVGLLVFTQTTISNNQEVSLGIAVTISLFVAAVIWLFFNARILVGVFTKAYPKLFLNRILAIIGEYSPSELLNTLLLSALRYGVFSIQFYCLLTFFEIGLPISLVFSGIFLVFLSKTLIPSLSLLGDLGLREITAVLFFNQYGAAEEKVIAACLILWCINLLLPTLVGLIFILKIRFWPTH